MGEISVELCEGVRGAGQTADIRVSITHFRLRSLELEEAKVGLGISPGVILVMPQKEEAVFSVKDQLFTVPPGAIALFDGRDDVVIIERGHIIDDQHRGDRLHMMEIGATINGGSRLQDLQKYPYWINHSVSKRVVDFAHDISAIHQELTKASTYGAMSFQLSLCHVVSLILSSDDQPLASSKRKNEKLKEFLLRNLKHKVTTADMADFLSMSRSHFYRIGKELLGESPATYLRKLRIERGLELLTQTSTSIEEISEAVGFSDRFHFSKEFKNLLGCSPVQYRKRNLATTKRVNFEKAQMYFEQQRYQEALVTCENCLKKRIGKADQEAMIFLKGQCLSALGHKKKAFDAWSQLSPKSELGWQVGLLRSRMLFQGDRFDKALEEIELLWANAEELQRADVIQLWIEQTTSLISLRKPEFLRSFLRFRKRHFISDQQSKMTAVRSCQVLWESLEILEHCSDDPYVRFRALVCAGEYQKAIDRHGSQVSHGDLANALYSSGQYEKVLELQPGIPELKGRSLRRLGRENEALKTYPDKYQEDHLREGNHSWILEHIPEPNATHLYSLYATEQFSELEKYDIRGSWFWHLAQLHFRPEYLLDLDYPDTHLFLPQARMLSALKIGASAEYSLDFIRAIPSGLSKDFWPFSHSGTGMLLRPILLSILDENYSYKEELLGLIERWKYFQKQTLFHDAAYLLGKIEFKEWERQPFQDEILHRGLFVSALKQDISGKKKQAMKIYRKFDENILPCLGERLLQHRFVKWRLNMLES